MELGWLPARPVRLLAAVGIAAAALAVAPPAQPRSHANLSLKINFTPAGVITVTLPDGTPVGTTAGAPTVIPAGFYTLLFSGPGECINLPLFELRGPGVNVNDDMLGGETDVHTLYATFLPNSTYTWHSDRNPAIVYTFRSSADVVGTAPATTTTSTPSKPNAKPTSQDVVGSEATPFRGTLAGAVTAAGRLTVSFRGKSVASLKAGRYTVAVNDKSSSDGFLLAKPNRRPVPVTGTTFLGKRSLSVTLTAGKWLVMPKAGHAVYSIVVT